MSVAPGKIESLSRKLAEMEQVNDVLEIAGEYQILLRLYSESTEALRKTLDEEIGMLPGVQRTATFYIFKSWKGTCT